MKGGVRRSSGLYTDGVQAQHSTRGVMQGTARCHPEAKGFETGWCWRLHRRCRRSARALTLALAEMDVQGVSTRNVAAVTEQVCGVELFSMQVSRAAAQLDMGLEQWRSRPPGRCV